MFGSAGIQSNFDFVSSYCEPTFGVEKFQSRKTGLKFYHVNVPLPSIKLEICVQTRPFDDTGCPHTLEHLIFMGSRKYPQQGYLDYISAQHFCPGTNATTYRDMTTYELSTIDRHSLGILLPIYLDHVFNPLLTQDCYLTEVHHIFGETGHDSGVVYSEMQSYESQPNEILEHAIMRELWSRSSPFHYNAGGRLEAIRDELSLEKIKTFHRMFYVPKNVAIVVCGGGIKADEILKILHQFEQENFLGTENRKKTSRNTNVESQRKRSKPNVSEAIDIDPPIKNDSRLPCIQIKQASFDEDSESDPSSSRPPNPTTTVPLADTSKLSVHGTNIEGNESSFCESEYMVSHGELSPNTSPPASPPTLPLMEGMTDISGSQTIVRDGTKHKEVCYPVEDNEDNLGQVAFGYRLESIYEMETYTALDVLLTTLFDEDISIFYKEFIEMPNTLCSSIDHDWFNYPERVLIITFEGVEVDNLTLVADKYTTVLRAILDSQDNDNRLLIQLNRNLKKKLELHLNQIENEPFNFLTDLCCLDHISELSVPEKHHDNEDNDNDDEQQSFHKFLLNKQYLKDLFDRSAFYWYELIRKYLLEWDSTKRTIILLKPSNELLIEQQEQEEQRIARRLESLGTNGLEQLKEILDRARHNNKQSSSLCTNIDGFITLDHQLHLPPIEHVDCEQQHIDLFHSPSSHFIKTCLYIPLKNLPHDLQSYLPLFANLLFHTAIDYGQAKLSKFTFCELISQDVLEYSVTCGISSSSPVQSVHVLSHYMDTLVITFQTAAEEETYARTLDYLRFALFGTVFNDYSIIIEECEKQLKNLIETLQDGEIVQQSYFNCLILPSSSHYYHRMNIFIQKLLFERIVKHAEKMKDEVIKKLERIQLFIRQNLPQTHMTICGNMENIKDNWSNVERIYNEMQVQTGIGSKQVHRQETKILASLPSATIVGSPHEESAYVLRWTHLSIAHIDLVPLLIFSTYLNMENGPLWMACRTNGHAYGVAYDFDLDTNLILLSIDQCSALTLAYSSAMNALEKLVQRTVSLDSKRMIAARNSTLCMLIENLSTLGRVTKVCIQSYLNRYSIDIYQNLIDQVRTFNYDQELMLKILDKYLSPLLLNNEQTSILMLVNTNKMKETQTYLNREHAINNVTLIKDVIKHFRQ